MSTVSRHWERLEDLFFRAADLPRDQQTAFIDRETDYDPALGRELRALLANDRGAKDRIARAIEGAVEAADASGDWIGRRVGPYRITREIGRGGMGVVFEATRDDDEYRKIVALKLAPWWRDLDVLRERFRYERQILASLEHPNIARFLDGGTHRGVPYFAMEYVEGVPLTVYAEQRGLKVREKIRLFRQICAAVEYAHQNLVVHRDLKPGNILVTAERVPKLLDFGIARLLTPTEGAGRTVTGPAPWTPNYASPEQVRGQQVTIRTDVYSLGLILYELLTGERGQNADASSPLALDRAVCETEPPLPSACAAARGERSLARQLSGDLDSIVAMAIRKEPERRYSSVAALTADLSRYLNGLPVEARAATLAYRAWKLVRRHRGAVAVGLLVLATLAAGVAATVYQANQANRRYQQARLLAKSLLFGVPDRLQNLAGATETREWAVTNALAYLDDLAKDAGRDKSMLAELAAGYLKIGDVQGYPILPNLGHREAALASYRKAESAAERLGEIDGGAETRLLLARSHHRIGMMLRLYRHLDESIAEYRRALDVVEPLYNANPGNTEIAAMLTTILRTLGQAQSAAGEVADASRLWLRVADVEARAAAAVGDRLRERAARTGKYVIRALMYRGDLEQAERVGLEGVRVRQELSARQPANAALRRDLANAYGDLAYVYFDSSYLSFGDRTAAAAWQEKSLAIARDLALADPNNLTAQSDLNITEVDVCAALNAGSPAQAVPYCRDAIAIAHRWPQVSAQEGWAALAEGLERLGRRTEALEAIRTSMRIREDMYRQDPGHFVVRQQVLRGGLDLAGILLERGDAAGALEQYRKSVSLAEELAAAIPTNLLSRRDLADAYEAMGRYFQNRDRNQARAWYQKSLDIWTGWPRMAYSGRMDQARRTRAQQLIASCQ